MKPALVRPLLGTLLAIAITTTMDATGLTNFSALPLFPLMGVFWYLERLPRRSVGFIWGRPRDYGLAALHPVTVLGAMALIAAAVGAVDLSHADGRKAAINLAITVLSTFLVAILTEEGFFRGWLWGSLQRAGMNQIATLVATSVAFAAWHISAITLPTGFDVPAAQVPVFLINAAVLGFIWGLLRLISGSVIVSSACHGIWNGIDYVFFGFGTRVGALGITNTARYGPEVGTVGLALNVAFAAALWWWWRARGEVGAAAKA